MSMTARDILMDAGAFRRAYPDWPAAQAPAARNDTLGSARRTAAAQGCCPDGPETTVAGEGDRKSAGPRAAGATSPRGAQPSGRRVIICQLCRRRVHRQRDGSWYHNRTASQFCNWPNGNGNKAVSLEIKVDR